MPRTTIRQAFSVARRMPPLLARTSVQALNTNLNAADADAVLRRGETKELRRDLASARAAAVRRGGEPGGRPRARAPAGGGAPTPGARRRARPRLDPRTRLLALDTFRADAEAALAAAVRDGRPVALAVVDIDGFRALN